MSVQTQIDRISGNVSAALAAIADKGVTVPDGSTSDALAELIAAIEAGGSASGFAKVATGTITPDSNTTSLTIEHGLGQAPDVAILYYEGLYTVGMLFSILLSSGKYLNAGKSLSNNGLYSDSTAAPTKTQATFVARVKFDSSSTTTNLYFMSGFTYRWIAGVFA